MRNYDFLNLSDKDFEILATDLLSVLHGVRFERFKPGKDRGIDGRYFLSKKNEIVLQCKHWARSGVPALLRSLNEIESKKVKRLKPARYLFVTSLELSRDNKKSIKDIFTPHIQSESDIYGKEDLNDLLSLHEDIEQKHYKLWLSSTAVLDRILHSAILGRSDFLLKEVIEKRSRYVLTGNHAAGKRKLETLGVVLITGEPGVGKTMLAEQLCLDYVVDGFQLCVLGKSIEEAEGIFKPDRKQIYYFDDFLGRNFLSALARHEDSHIVGFIRRVQRDKSKRFILTSRTTVLNQGKRLSDLFALEHIEKNEFEIRVEHLTPIDKAHILYNHVWFSNLDRSYVEQILIGKRYRKIIDHKNFNPRLIAFITDSQRIQSVSALNYWKHIEGMLANPADVWEHPYQNLLDDYDRTLLLLTVYSGSQISESELQRSYETFLKESVASKFRGISDFDANLKTLVGSLVNRTVHESGAVSYSLFNPSIADYVLNKTAKDSALITAVMCSLSSVECLKNLRQLIANRVITIESVLPCFDRMANEQLLRYSGNYALEYKALLASIIVDAAPKKSQATRLVMKFANGLTETPTSFRAWKYLAPVLTKGLELKAIAPETVARLIHGISSDEQDADDIGALADLRQHLPTDMAERFAAVLTPLVRAYWEDNIDYELHERATLSQYCDEEEYDDAERAARRAIEDILAEYNLEFSTDDIEKILSSCDIYDFIRENQEAQAQMDDRYGEIRGAEPSASEIDDLFEVDLPPRSS